MPLGDIVSTRRRTGNRAFDPRGQRAREMEARKNGSRQVRAALPYWFTLVAPFTGVVGQRIASNFTGQNFELEMRAAWTNLVKPRVQLTDTNYGNVWSNELVPIDVMAGQSLYAHPLLYLRKPYLLLANSVLHGDFIDDAGTEGSGQLIWACVRPDTEILVTVEASREWYLAIALNLTGTAATFSRATSLPVDEDLLIYGAMSTATPSTLIRIVDNHTNIGWSEDKLPLGAFAGVQTPGTPVQRVMWYPEPYFVPRNTAMIIEWNNVDSLTGQFFTFICERIIRSGSHADEPTPITPVPPGPPTPTPDPGGPPAPVQPPQQVFHHRPPFAFLPNGQAHAFTSGGQPYSFDAREIQTGYTDRRWYTE